MRWRRVLTWVAACLLLVLAVAAALLYQPDKPRVELEARYAAPPSEFRTVLGLRVHLRDTGPRDAPAVLLLHGFGANLHTWDAWAGLLESDRRVIRLDLPGFGLTGPDPTGNYRDPRAVAILTALLDDLRLDRVDVIGSSMGGRVAWRFAADRPELVRRLVLMAPDGLASHGLEYDTPARVPLLLNLLPYVLPTPLLRATLANAYADPAKLRPETLELYRDMILAPGVRRAVLDRTRGHVLDRPEPILARIAAPVLLLWGEQDRMVPLSAAPVFQAALRNERLVALPGLGHVPMEEDPERALAPVRQFLEE